MKNGGFRIGERHGTANAHGGEPVCSTPCASRQGEMLGELSQRLADECTPADFRTRHLSGAQVYGHGAIALLAQGAPYRPRARKEAPVVDAPAPQVPNRQAAESFVDVARQLKANGNPEGAMKEYESAISADPDYLPAHVELATLYFDELVYAPITAFELKRVMELDPTKRTDPEIVRLVTAVIAQLDELVKIKDAIAAGHGSRREKKAAAGEAAQQRQLSADLTKLMAAAPPPPAPVSVPAPVAPPVSDADAILRQALGLDAVTAPPPPAAPPPAAPAAATGEPAPAPASKDDASAKWKVNVHGKSIHIEPPLRFASGSAEIASELEPVLKGVAQFLIEQPELKTVRIIGYTDRHEGHKDAALALGMRRADAVATFLTSNGVDKMHLEIIGRGYRDPIAPNFSPKGREKNRRVELSIEEVAKKEEAAPVAKSDAPAEPTDETRAAAKEHYKRAQEHYNAGRYRESIVELQQAYALVPHPAVLLNIGRADAKLAESGDATAVDDAIKNFHSYLEQVPDASNRSEIEEQIATLEKMKLASAAAPAPAPAPAGGEPSQTAAPSDDANAVLMMTLGLTPPPPPASAPAAAPAPAKDEAPPAPAASAAPVQKAVTGDDIDKIKRGHSSMLTTCYERALARDSSLTKVRVDVTVDVLVGGAVKSVTIQPPNADTYLGQCLKNTMKHWTFPNTGAEYSVPFPILFQGK